MTEQPGQYDAPSDLFTPIPQPEIHNLMPSPMSFNEWVAASPPELKGFLVRFCEHYVSRGDDAEFKEMLEDLAIAVGIV